MKTDVRLILGSKTDGEKANIVLGVWKKLNVKCQVSIASCHWHTGKGFEAFIAEIPENYIAYLGGMEFSAPGLASGLYRNFNLSGKIVISMPTDKAARSATENLPMGTPLLTCGLNEISLKHGLTNGALAIAHLIAINNLGVKIMLGEWYKEKAKDKKLIPEVTLSDGLIPEKIKEKEV
ncbi:hypothetical protein KAU19_07155 [Candidatus Parcubacteria bacterium]|nr:hypothetical protein [Candidatus Parcubacteria bacterium]